MNNQGAQPAGQQPTTSNHYHFNFNMMGVSHDGMVNFLEIVQGILQQVIANNAGAFPRNEVIQVHPPPMPPALPARMEEEVPKCSVCYDREPNSRLSCYHVFCNVCLVRLLEGDARCPLCRAPFDEWQQA